MRQKLADAYERVATVLDNIFAAFVGLLSVAIIVGVTCGGIYMALLILRAIADFVLRR